MAGQAYRTALLRAFPAVKRTTRRLGILMASPVRGFFATRARRWVGLEGAEADERDRVALLECPRDGSRAANRRSRPRCSWSHPYLSRFWRSDRACSSISRLAEASTTTLVVPTFRRPKRLSSCSVFRWRAAESHRRAPGRRNPLRADRRRRRARGPWPGAARRPA